ncbi:ectonucleoside triphosphate diphosphohydrolase 3-like [Panonychus citri]|uniref:ectonucleoside triphosphate diphosphohydrolase 3-like n=1 Tax=Panonychus citri TaxID=50023 RepID=UPI0023074EDD|nr:ectonucleoside triphosphate diphosphohydrolase 3-like [Panonychus citri]
MALNPRVKSIIFITTGLIIFTISAITYAIFNHKTHYQYGVLVDSGNPNVTISLYRWPVGRLNSTGLAELAETCISSDLTDYLSNSTDLSTVYQPCLSRVIGSLDDDQQSSSTSQLFFTVSGPLMLLNSSNGREVASLIQSSIEYLTNATKLNVQPVQVINDQAGSVFPWIAVNSLEARNYFPESTGVTTIKHTGVIELSFTGSSISFEVTNSSLITSDQIKSSLVNVTLFGNNHTLWEKYSCLGSDKGRLRYLVELISGSSETTVGDPCLPIGVNQTINTLDLISPHDPCLIQHLTKSLTESNKEFTLMGKGDGSTCSKLISDLLTDKSKCSDNPSTCYSPPALAPENTVYTAVADLLYPVTVLKMTNANHTIDYENYYNQSLNLCSMSRDDLLITSGGKLAPTSLCFQLLYNYHTIESVFGLKGDNWSRIVFDPNLRGDSTINWSTGFMINATTSIPLQSVPKVWFNWVFFLVLTAISLVYLVIGAYFLASSLRTQRVPNKEIYEPIQQQPQP